MNAEEIAQANLDRLRSQFVENGRIQDSVVERGVHVAWFTPLFASDDLVDVKLEHSADGLCMAERECEIARVLEDKRVRRLLPCVDGRYRVELRDDEVLAFERMRPRYANR